MKNKFNYYITKYFKEYLPNTKGGSYNTILSYRDTLSIFIEYLKIKKKFNINNLDMESIDYLVIEEFLDYLEKEKNNSIRTRNQRLAAIHSFYTYIQKRELSYYELCANILNIQFKKFPKKSISYFSLEEIEILLKSPNTEKKYGFRDYVLLMYIYETASRGQEVCDLTLQQLILTTNSSSVIIHGKGNKERIVPISQNLADLLRKYIDIFKIQNEDYVFKNANNSKLTRKGIEYILSKYIKLEREKHPDKFKQKYSNHSIRHSRAMHLLEAGINLIYIRDILGHESVTTTEIYAKANPVIKEQQIIKHSKSIDAENKFTETEKQDLLDFLKQL